MNQKSCHTSPELDALAVEESTKMYRLQCTAFAAFRMYIYQKDLGTWQSVILASCGITKFA